MCCFLFIINFENDKPKKFSQDARQVNKFLIDFKNLFDCELLECINFYTQNT